MTLILYPIVERARILRSEKYAEKFALQPSIRVRIFLATRILCIRACMGERKLDEESADK